MPSLCRQSKSLNSSYFTAICLSVLVVLLSLTGCASSTRPINSHVATADDLIENYKVRSDEFALEQLQSALQQYESFDQADGRWRAHFEIANWYIANLQSESAMEHAKAAYTLAKDISENAKRFASCIQLGQLTKDYGLFVEAEDYASSQMQRAILLMHQARVEASYALFSSQEVTEDTVADLAFLYYNYGKAKGHLPSILKARDYYIQSENQTGLIDALFLAAQTSQNAPAKAFAERALVAAKAVEDSYRAQAIEKWLSIEASDGML